MNFNIRRKLAKSLCILVGFTVTSVNAIEIEEIVDIDTVEKIINLVKKKV